MELQNIKPELKTFLYEQIFIKRVASFDALYTEGYMCLIRKKYNTL
ncbi:hypothetical protein [Bacillus pseudomycoides]|nr:hypothetical protein [Bacillus pseudomycoides]